MNAPTLLTRPGVTLGPTVAEGVARLTATAPPRMSEREFQSAVIAAAEDHGWWCYHVYNAKRSKAGWPDLVMLRDRLIVAELKVPPNVPTAAQLNCLERFRRAGIPAYVWTPADLAEIVQVLR